MDDEKEVETYNEYLSVFMIMGVIVFCAAFIATWMGEIPVTKDTPVKLCDILSRCVTSLSRCGTPCNAAGRPCHAV